MLSSPAPAVGCTTRSKDLDSAAFDIAMVNHDPVAFEDQAGQATVRWTLGPPNARDFGFLGFGLFPRPGFMQSTSGPRASEVSAWLQAGQFLGTAEM